MTVFFIGAGPGDPELITVRGQRLVRSCPVVLYAGSLVPAAVLEGNTAERVVNTAELDLDAIVALLEEAHRKGQDVARQLSFGRSVALWCNRRTDPSHPVTWHSLRNRAGRDGDGSVRRCARVRADVAGRLANVDSHALCNEDGHARGRTSWRPGASSRDDGDSSWRAPSRAHRR